MADDAKKTQQEAVPPEQFNSAAIDRYLQYLKFFPDSVETHFNLAIAYAETHMFEQAELEFKKTIALKPEFAEAYINLGGLYFAMGDWEACLHYNAEAYRLGDKNFVALANVGLAHLMMGEIQKSIDTCKKVVENVPEFAQAHYCLAVGYLEIEEKEKAKTHYLRSLELGFEPDPSFQERMAPLLEDK